MATLLERLGLVRKSALPAVEVAPPPAPLPPTAPLPPPTPEEVARVIMDQAGITLAQGPPPGAYAFNNPHLFNQLQSPERRPKATVTLTTLRALADNYDILRACIEHLKREVATVPIVVVSRSGDKSRGALARIAQAQALFLQDGPVGRVSCEYEHFEQMMLEDAIVIGSPVIFHRYAKGGQWLWCDVIDAATIRPVTDAFGWEPEGGLFEQWIQGIKVATLTGRDISYDKLAAVSWQPYSRSPVEWLVHTINRALQVDSWNLNWFTEGTTPADMLSVPKEWDADQVIRFTTWWNAMLSGKTSERVKTRFIPGGSTRLGNQTARETDFTPQELWLLRRTCAIMGVQPASIGFTGEQYKVSQEESMHSTSRFGGGVLIRLRKRRLDDILRRAGFADLETALPQEQTEKPKERAEREEIEIRSGKRTINEVRAGAELPPVEGGDVSLVLGTLTPLAQAVAPPPDPAQASDPTTPAPTPAPAPTRVARVKSLQQAAMEYRALMEQSATEAQAATLALWQGAEAAIRESWYALMERMADLQIAGTVTSAQLAQEARYQQLLAQIETQIASLSEGASAAVAGAQESGTGQVLDALPSLASRAAGQAPVGVSIAWNTVPAEAIEALIGYASDGSPLADLFVAIGPSMAEGATRALVSGLAQGQNPTETAKALDAILNVGRARAENIARTETLRALREASRLSFVANPEVIEGWIWTSALQTRTCPACWAMHGTFHQPDETLHGHPQCRCAMVPAVRSWGQMLGDPTLPDDRPHIESGEEAFARLSEGQQREVLGDGLYALWSQGDLPFSALATEDTDPRWGPTIRPVTLAEASARVERPATAAAAAHLRLWERKALRRLKESGSAVCAFESDSLPTTVLAQVRDALVTATTPNMVRAAFKSAGVVL